MENPTILLPSTPRFPPKGHTRTVSRSPTRPRLMDDMLADLSPATTLEAFTSASGTLKASIEAASPTQRAFGIRAAIASKKIHEWTTELSAWPWPSSDSEGFEPPTTKRRKVSNANFDNHQAEAVHDSRQHQSWDEKEYWGCLPAHDVRRYESRIEEISEDMEDLNVEEIKSQVLDRHVLPRSRSSSLSGPSKEAVISQSYTRMDDFTAVVTATVLQALPSLSRLMALLDVWSVRLSVLRQVPSFMASMEDADVALRSGWKAIQSLEPGPGQEDASSKISTVSYQDYEIIRDVLQEKVSKLGQKLDHMLDSLEGRNDTLPDAWLDRMESIEQDYGEWVVCGERKVREDQWMTESSARRLEQLRRSPPAVVESPLPNSKGDSVLEPEENNVAKATPFAPPQAVGNVEIGVAPFKDSPSSEHRGFHMPAMAPLSNHLERSPLGGSEDAIAPRPLSNDAPSVEKEMSQPTGPAKLTESNQYDVEGDLLSLASGLSPSQGQIDTLAHQEELVTNLSSLSDGTFDKADSKHETMRSIDLPQPRAKFNNDIPTIEENDFEANRAEIMKPMTPAVARQILTADSLPESNGSPSTPVESSHSQQSSSSPSTWQADSSIDENHEEHPRPPINSSKIPRFGHPLANSLRREMPSGVPTSPSPRQSSDSNRSLQNPKATTTPAMTTEPGPVEIPRTPEEQDIEDFGALNPTSHSVMRPPPADIQIPDQPTFTTPATSDPKSTHIDLPSSHLITVAEKRVVDHLSPDVISSDSGKGHTRGPSSASLISGYATSEPSPIIYEAEPTEYFRPVSPPIIATLPEPSNTGTPTQASFNNTPLSVKAPESVPDGELDASKSRGFSQLQRAPLDSNMLEHPTRQNAESESSGPPTRRRPVSNDSVISVIRSALSRGLTSQEGSVSPDVSTINEKLNTVTSTPVRIELPPTETVPRSWHSQFVSNYDGDSPSLVRARTPKDIDNYSPVSSPPSETPPSQRRQLQLHKTASFDADSFYPESPATPGEPPSLSNVELSPTPALSSPSKHSDDQLQQQISEILESIPARIRLTSEPDTAGTSGMKQVKKRISLNPFSRPVSRAATPSFTLAPAYTRNPRPRPQNGNPEIKLYHLSRSTGEAPIKLFVRLVGENGERVMVRVGGGWADLGEYLKEYASHHGRRSDQPGKVEIQDLPSRVVSTGSTASTSTLRNGTWNTSEASSPVSRPGSRPSSALGRPLSSLAIRKTRKSVGEEAREKTYRSPSTPLPPSFRSSPSFPRPNETPPSANSGRSVSQMSWREEESSLGLAGPRSRKGEISAENAAWVESMKEKVRIASAEKEKREKAAFGDMGQVGATKRLFKRSG